MIRHWFRPPRHVLAIFVAVAMVSAAALAWLMGLLLQQDRTVETQRRQDHLEQAADHAAVVMAGALTDIERQVVQRLEQRSNFPGGVFSFNIGPDGVELRPGDRLLYYPEPQQRIEAPPSRLAESEQQEFERNDLPAAAQLYAQLATNSDIAVRAAALTGLARVKRRMHEPGNAIVAYGKLSQISNVNVSGLPADLIAREGRASALEEMNRTSDVQSEAAAFQSDLRSGRWKLTKSEYKFYSAQVKNWLGKPEAEDDPEAIVRAEAVAWLWENRRSIEPVSRRLIQTGHGAALILSQTSSDGDFAAVAGPPYLDSLCRQAISDSGLRCTLTDIEGNAVVGQSPSGRLSAVRTSAAAQLPWTLQVFEASDSTASSVSPRGRLLWWVAAVLAVVWFTGAGFIIRVIQREARVAQLQSDFVAAVSHEFRSPLTSLCQISEMLTLDRFDSEVLRHQSYGVLSRETERLSRLVEGLLDFGRFEAGAMLYHFESLEIGTFLKTITTDFQQRVAPTGYTIELREPQKQNYVKADREALSRAIWNLLDNAVKYSPECHTVWVEVEGNNDRVSIIVRDHGLGIPAHEQSEIFEKFVRGADSKARRIKGTGIGLAMVRHIVQAHGGEIILASQPGEGSRFTMVLPEGINT